MTTIRNGLYHILDKNHLMHTKSFQRLLEGKHEILFLSNNAYSKKIEYEKYLEESKKMLEAINISEKSILEKVFEINEKYKKQ